MITGRTLSDPLPIGPIIRRLVPFILLGIIVNLAFSFFQSDRHQLGQLAHVSPVWLAVAVVLAWLPWGWHCLRLRIWTCFFGHDISWKNLLAVVVSTDVGGAVTPTAVGGAPLKMALLVKNGLRPGQAAMLTLLGNLEDVLFFCMAVPLSLFFTKKWDNPLWSAAVVFVKRHHVEIGLALLAALSILLIIRFLFLKNNKTGRWQGKLRQVAKEFGEAWQLIRSRGRTAFCWSMLALAAQWFSRYSVLVAVILALDLEVDLLTLYLLQWMVFVAILFVPTPGAIGGAEAAFLLVFAGAVPTGAVAVVMAAWRLVMYYFMLLTGVVILGRLSKQADLPTDKNRP